MDHALAHFYTGFEGHRRIASGPIPAVALLVKRALESGTTGPILIFDDATGRSIDIDIRGSDEEIVSRLTITTANDETAKPALPGQPPQPIIEPGGTETPTDEPRGRGRPKLGVIPREVTLLPRHWDWLATQPGGASVALRKLVEEARRTGGDKERIRKAQERAYHFMSAMAGDMPGFEEATRALFANDRLKFSEHITTWPGDVRDYAIRLAFGGEGERVADNNAVH